jgi:hypothetical protein
VIKELLLDVSDLEAPEPLTKIIYLINKLELLSYLRVIHRKEPFPLYSILHENGFDYKAIKMHNSEYTILIWRVSDIETANHCHLIQNNKEFKEEA